MVTETVDANGVMLSYLERGSGPTVVLSHGVIQDHRTWGALADSLSSSFRTIAYSRRCSCPNRDREYANSTVYNNATDLSELIIATGGGPVDLVGQSYGGEVAALCAMRYPALIRNLVLIEPALLSALIPDPFSSSQRMRMFFRDPSAAVSGIRFQRKGLDPAIRELDDGNDEKALRCFVDGLRGERGSLDSYQEETRKMMLENVGTIRETTTKTPYFTRKEARRIPHPTLLVMGGRTISMFSSIIGALHKAMPNSQVVTVPDAAHIVHLENPEGCSGAILRFLTDHDH